MSLTFAKVLFIIAILIAVLWWLFIILAGFTMGGIGAIFDPYGYRGGGSPLLGILAILFGWIPPAFFLIVVRVGLELTVATVKTAQNTSILVERE